MTERHDQERQNHTQPELERLFREGKLSNGDSALAQEQQLRHQQNLDALQQRKIFAAEVPALVEGLGKDHFTAAIPAIEQLLNSEDPLVRASSLKSLTRYF